MKPFVRRCALFLSVLASACACRGPELEPVPTSIRVEPRQLDFGRVIVGQVASRTIEVTNTGKTALEGTWALSGEAFTTDDGLPTRATVGSTLMTIRCAPQSVGAWDGVARITLERFEPIEVPLSCEGAPVPQCLPSAPCRTAAWDVIAGRCAESSLPDGTSCPGGDVCLLDAVCRSGRCEGTPRDCADSDPCTTDSCHPVRGCEHGGNVVCPNESPCRVGVCTPGVGCGIVEAEDGTPCGPNRSCTSADICISGACVQRRPPEGFTCVPEGPCGGEGRCASEVCVQTAVTPVEPEWRWGGQPDAGPPEAWADLFSDRDGGLVLSSYFMSPPRLGASSGQPIDLTQTARRCIEWLGRVVCGDLPALSNAPVAAIDPATGQQVWSFTGASLLIPEFVGPSVQYFTARLAVMNENELLVLYESRTLMADGSDPRCRSYGVVVLDRQGQALLSLFLDDPIFSVCDHPHSYGVAVDADSNIYLAFTPSGADNPATTLLGTTIFSYTPALQLRWRRYLVDVPGGELAVADGRLFLEKSDWMRSAATGDTFGSPLPVRFGLGVAGRGIFVLQGDSIQARSTVDSMPRWHRTLQGTVGPSPLTIASWRAPWGPRDVVLSFATDGQQVTLEATDLLTGQQAFQCPVSLPDVPVMTAVTPGGVGLMLHEGPAAPGWPRCDDCDPRWARTRNGFAWLPLPGVAPSRASWAGTWGNDGHSHRENR